MLDKFFDTLKSTFENDIDLGACQKCHEIVFIKMKDGTRYILTGPVPFPELPECDDDDCGEDGCCGGCD